MWYRKINAETGIFIEDTFDIELLENGSINTQYDYIEEPVPDSIYAESDVSPKWTGSEWVATAETPQPTLQPPSVEERLEMAEMALLEIMMG